MLLESSDFGTRGRGSGERNTVRDNKRVKEAIRAQMRKSEQTRSIVQYNVKRQIAATNVNSDRSTRDLDNEPSASYKKIPRCSTVESKVGR